MFIRSIYQCKEEAIQILIILAYLIQLRRYPDIKQVCYNMLFTTLQNTTLKFANIFFGSKQLSKKCEVGYVKSEISASYQTDGTVYGKS